MFGMKSCARGALVLVSLLAGLAIGACDDDDDPIGPIGGSIEVVVTTSGSAVDPDGYAVALEGQTASVSGRWNEFS